jgi:hypothetical protein
VAGFTDVTNNWNGWQRFSKAITLKEGYLMRFEADVSHGITRGNLMALARKFGGSLSTFRACTADRSQVSPSADSTAQPSYFFGISRTRPSRDSLRSCSRAFVPRAGQPTTA